MEKLNIETISSAASDQYDSSGYDGHEPNSASLMPPIPEAPRVSENVQKAIDTAIESKFRHYTTADGREVFEQLEVEDALKIAADIPEIKNGEWFDLKPNWGASLPAVKINEKTIAWFDNGGEEHVYTREPPGTGTEQRLYIDGELQVPAAPTVLVLRHAADSTLDGVLDEGESGTISGFKAGIDKVELGFETNGFVKEDVQEAIDAALRDAHREGLSAENSMLPNLRQDYEIATKVPGVEKGNIFFLNYSIYSELGIKNDEKTLIGFDGSVPRPEDVFSA